MNDIQFNEPDYARPAVPAEQPSWLSSLVIRTGLAKNTADAQKVLIIALVVLVALGIWINWPSSPTSGDEVLLGYELLH